MGWLARLPIRLRLTLAFAVAMAVVLVAAGLFLYLRLGAALDRTIDRSLLGRADDVTALVRAAGSGLRQAPGPGLVEQEESFAQVLAPDGAVLDSTPGLRDRRLLSGPELARATRTIVLVDRPPFPDSDDPLRLLATPVQAEGGPVVVVVGTSTEERVEALESLLRQLLLGGPIVLAVASLLGYGLAAAAPPAGRRRDRPARGHPQHHAGPPGGGAGPGTTLRLRRQPRAPHPAGGAPHRAGAGPAPTPPTR